MYARLARWSVRAAVGAGMAGMVADLAGARSLLVTVLVLVFIAVAPTAAIAGLLRGFDVFARLVIACVTSIVVITLIAMIMLATGIWSPQGGLVAIALASGACVLARHSGPVRARLAGRARTVRTALADYWVTAGGERTAGQVTASARAMAEADSAAEPDRAAGQDGHAPVTAGNGARPARSSPGPAGRGTSAAPGKTPASDGLTSDLTIEQRLLAADSVAGKPSSVRDSA